MYIQLPNGANSILIRSFYSIPSLAETTFRDFCFEISSNIDYEANPYYFCIIDVH